jgi:hypothetical protein
MKTNVVMQSADRNLFGIIIKQNTKNGQSLSVSDLMKAYEKARMQYGWSDKRLSDIMNSKAFKERCFYILKKRGLVKAGFSAFMDFFEKEGVVNVLKGLDVWKTSGRGNNKSTYADPHIWVLLALELNPMIYADVVMWLTDSLIFNRILAGSEFLPMNRAISSVISNPDYSLYCREINNKVFGRHEKGIRNTASDKELRLISDIEKFVTQLIEQGILTNEQQLLRVITNYKAA